MEQAVKQSLITRSGIALGVLVFISVVTMLLTFLTAESAENDAVRINIAGSLRMQSYRIAETLLLDRSGIEHRDDTINEELAEFEHRFYQPVLSAYIRNSSDQPLQLAYGELERQWFQIKQQVVDPDRDMAALLEGVDSFVTAIDRLVKVLEFQTESKLRLLRSIQGISMFVTVIVVVVLLLDLSTKVVAPLRQLVTMANKVRNRDFSMRLNVGRDDELALLSDTFNTMAGSLDAMYRELEDKVQEKTRHLERARDELGLLYETSQLLTGGGNIRTRLDRALAAVQNYFKAVQARVELTSGESTQGLALAVPRSRQHPDADKASVHRFAIERKGEQWGELVVSSSSAELPRGHRRTLQLVADNIAAAFSAESQNEQQHRLVLMEERAVIARELHDSLAQTLSYLKIQISRLQMLQAKGAEQQQIDATLDQLKAGISSAYAQLRELLSTFRLQLSSQGLRAALQATVLEFAERGDFEIGLDYRLDDFPLRPNEEIHVLQIVREALSNVLRHSGARQAQVQACIGSGQGVRVRVSDDGIGFGDNESRENHYGKIIMRERAQSLRGTVDFHNLEAGGAEVVLRFLPDVIAQAAAAGN